ENNENNEEIEIFKKNAPKFGIIRSTFSQTKDFNPEKKIVISFEEEINLYDLLGYKKVIDGKYECNGKILKSAKKVERCISENKMFLSKIGEDGKVKKEEVFKGVVKKSKIDKKTIIISAKFDEWQDYELKILKGLKSDKINKKIDPENILYSELKEDFVVNFTTTNKEGEHKPKAEKVVGTGGTASGEILSETGSDLTGTGNSVADENSEQKTEEELKNWLKEKTKKVGEVDSGKKNGTGTKAETGTEVETGTGENLETGTGSTETGSTSTGETN
ncbi:hypothetical protein LR002_02370, partial [Candidatus Gracilibacteria bacterium]|nr:hypothetical protein [Candidatus Gracilibacteria bacterium]